MKSSLFERVCKVEGLPDFLTAPDTRRGFKGRVPGRIEPAPSDDPNSFHRCMRSVLIVGQCFSLMPIRGISGGEASSLRFRWFHWSLFYSSLVIGGCLFMLGVAVEKIFDKGFEFEDSSLFFMSMAIGANLLFIQLARNWPQLSLEWERAEVSMKHHGYPRNLAIKLKVYMVVILIGSTVEHLLANLKRALTSTRCTDGTLTDWMQYCFVTGYSQVFNYFSYSHWKGIALFLIHLVATYIWNYMDMFVIILSIALVERFRLISAKLRKVRGKLRLDVWRDRDLQPLSQPDANGLTSLENNTGVESSS
ncbi:unnamed protein product, partial [Timema podura]|nr:unnamed protein product [Timema podura]